MSLGPRIDHLEYANIRASEGAGTTTLTSSDSRHQIFNLSASRTVVLPTTDVLAGETWILAGKSASYDLTVQASGGSALTKANSCNQDATISDGFVVLVALQDAPTLPTHWRVEHVEETFTFIGDWTWDAAGGGSVSNITLRISRQDNNITISYPEIHATSGTGSVTLSMVGASPLPIRVRPSYAVFSAIHLTDNNSAYDLGLLAHNTNGVNWIRKSNYGTFANSTTCGLRNGGSSSYTI